MSINTTTDLTLVELAELLSLDPAKAAFLEEQGVELSVNLKNIQLQKGTNVAVANVKMSVLNMVKADKLGPASKSMIKSELATAYDNMSESLKYGGVLSDEDVSEDSKYPYEDDVANKTVIDLCKEAYQSGATGKVKAIKKFRSLTGCGLKQAKAQVEVWINELEWDKATEFTDEEGNTYTESKPKKAAKKKKAAKTKIKEGIMNSNVVALRDATEVFQPVQGSGGTSVYFVIGIGEVNAAARVKGSKVSIRVEGEGLKDSEIREQLIEAGLSEASETHFSIHLQVKPDLIAKTIGAVLFAISQGHAFESMASDVSPIMGKGS